MCQKLFYKVLLISLTLFAIEGSKAQTANIPSLFANGKWLKIETSNVGIHKISYSWLKNLGFLHPENIKIYGSRNLTLPLSNAVVSDNAPVLLPTFRFKESGGNDVLIFYVGGPVTWNYDAVSGEFNHTVNQSARGKSLFFLTEDSGKDLSLASLGQPAGNPDMRLSDYDDYLVWEEENINLLESGTRWFTTLMTGGNILTRNFLFQDRVEGALVKWRIDAAGRSISSTALEVSVNGNSMGSVQFIPVNTSTGTDFASAGSFKTSGIFSGTTLPLSLRYNGSASDQCWVDFATVQVRRNLLYRGTPLLFRDGGTAWKNKLVEFQVGNPNVNLLLWEVTDPLKPVQRSFLINNGLLTFRFQSDSLRNFLLFDPQNPYPALTVREEIKNEDVRQTEIPQYLIVTPTAFYGQAKRLADYHALTDQLKTAVVSVEAIFNELSGGYPDVSALRNYVRNLYQQKGSLGPTNLKYLLLFGKGTCDPVHDPAENNPNWIPTWQSDNSLSTVDSFVSDDYFGFDDPSQPGNLSLGVGRIPAASLSEATIAVDKILHYHDAETLGSWRNSLLFIADDEDNSLHEGDSEKLALSLNRRSPEYSTSRIYLDAYPQVLTPEKRYPAVTEAIRRSVQTGDLIVNYVGHASEDGLAQERVLTSANIDAWTNKWRLPLFVTATCAFSRWDMSMKRSAGEHLLFHPAGGAIALLSATRLVYSASNFEINSSFLNHVFDKDPSGAMLRLGDLIHLVKNETGESVNAMKFSLLGDPALRLNYPAYNCENMSINNQPVSKFSGIVAPLSEVTFTGEIQDRFGKKMEQLTGSLSAEIYDQPTGKITLGNGGQPPFSYQVQENILFNGNVPVKNGSFRYSFIVPKDVNFNQEAGLIRYYFNDGSTDANGSFANIFFNGTGNIQGTDFTGPAIRLYLENEGFRDGATVSANPLLIAYLSDDSGINTTGFGIGHEITMKLDGQAGNEVILNDYYKSDSATWKSGSLFFALSMLSPGVHTLTLKAWDTADNSSEVTVRFLVSNGLVFDRIVNYPNPFREQTRFALHHNRYDEMLTVDLEIFDVEGHSIFCSRQLLASQGYELRDLYWNPLSSDPVPVGGTYLYRVTLTDQEGSHASRSGRLVWMK